MLKRFKINQLSIGLFVILSGTLAGLIAGGAINSKLPFLAVMCVIAIVMVSRQLNWGLAAIVFAIYINLSEVLISHHGLPSIAKIYVPAVLLLILLEWYRKNERLWLPKEGLAVFGIYAFVITLSVFYASDFARVVDGLTDLSKNLTIAVALALLVRRPEQFRVALWGIVGGALFLAAINSYKYLTGDFAGEYAGFAQSGVSFVVEDDKIFRLSGVMPGPNYFAQLMLIAVPISFERFLSESSRWLKLVALATFLLTVFVVLLTFSRGALLALLVVAAIVLLKVRWNPSWIAAGVLVVVLSVPFLPGGYVNRIASAIPQIGLSGGSSEQPDESVRGRLGEMEVAWQLFLDHPILGVGFNNYQNYFQQYTLLLDQMPRGEARPAHSLYLEVAAETGLLGLSAFGLLLLYLARAAYKGQRILVKSGNSNHTTMIAGLALGFMAYLIAAVFLHDAYPRYFWLLSGLILAVPGMVRSDASK